MNYSYEEIGAVCATFRCQDDIQPGQTCQICENDTVALADDTCPFDGVVVSRRGDCAAVMVRGFVTVPFGGDTPYVGSNYLQADGYGCVCGAQDGRLCLITHVDTVNNTVTFLL